MLADLPNAGNRFRKVSFHWKQLEYCRNLKMRIPAILKIATFFCDYEMMPVCSDPATRAGAVMQTSGYEDQ